MKEWIDFYDTTHTIYANARHRDVHFAHLAAAITAQIPSADAVVLDYSCGEADSAEQVAAASGRLILAEPATGVRHRLQAKFRAASNIEVIAPDDLAGWPPHSIDLAIINSVAQYMTPDELTAALQCLRRILRPNGRLVLGDILQPDAGVLTDSYALLSFAARQGFLTAAVIGLIKTALSDYRKLRNRVGLQHYAEGEIITLMAAAGFQAVKAPKNLGHNPWRMTFIGHPI